MLGFPDVRFAGAHMKFLLFLIGIFSAFGLCTARADNSQLQIMTEDFPPFNYVEGGELIGVGPEVVRALMDRMGLPGQIRVMGWKRAYNLTLNEPNMVLFSMARIPEREDKFHWVGPLMSVTDYFYANASFEKDSLTREEAKQVRGILVQEGGAHHQLLQAEGFENLKPYTNIANQIKLLTVGRGSLLQINDLTIAYQLRQQGLDLSSVKPVLALQRSDLFIAISKKTSPEVVLRWQQQLDQMREDGAFAEIEARYLPVMN